MTFNVISAIATLSDANFYNDETLDETLFTAVLNNDDHVLRYILPDRRNNTYCLRPKRHELTLAIDAILGTFFPKTFI